MADTEMPEVQVASDMVRVFDPKRGKVALVPSDTAARLQAAGYAVGDVEARQMAQDSGWGGAALTFGAGALSGATAGLSDAFMPKDLHDVRERLRAVHPMADTAGQVAGGIGAVAATGPLGLVGGIAARTAMGAVSGATEEYLRAQEHSEPINAERMVQRAGLGALINLGAEGLGAVIAKSGSAVSKTLELGDQYYRPGSKYVNEAGEAVRDSLIQKKYDAPGSIFGKIAKNAILSHIVPFYKAAHIGDAAAVAALNNVHGINNAIEKFVTPTAKALGKATSILTEAGAQMTGPDAPADQRASFQVWKDHLDHAMMNPQVIEEGVNRMGDFSQHEMLRAGMITKATEQVVALHGALPKNPNDVMIGSDTWVPTDKQIKDFHALAETVTDLPKAMLTPTRGKILIAKMTNPEQFNMLQDSIIGHITAKGTKGMSPQQMRACSLILGMPINQRTNPQFIAKMMVLRNVVNPGLDTPMGKAVQGGGAKPKSLTMGATDSQKLDFGLE